MIEDDGNDDDEEEYEIDYLTIKVIIFFFCYLKHRVKGKKI